MGGFWKLNLPLSSSAGTKNGSLFMLGVAERTTKTPRPLGCVIQSSAMRLLAGPRVGASGDCNLVLTLGEGPLPSSFLLENKLTLGRIALGKGNVRCSQELSIFFFNETKTTVGARENSVCG